MVEDKQQQRGQHQQQSRAHSIVESLLAKPSQKPDFASMIQGGQPDILKRAQAFLPAFIQSTDKILSSPEAQRQSQMDVKIAEADAVASEAQENELRELRERSVAQGSQVVNMVSKFCHPSPWFNPLTIELVYVYRKSAWVSSM